MITERLTLEEMEQRYPDQWVLIIDCELSENTELLSGKVVAHSKSRRDIRKVSAHYKGQVGTHYTGKTPDGTIYPTLRTSDFPFLDLFLKPAWSLH